MDERDKRRVGEQIEPGGRPKAPGRLEVLQRFINTWNHDFPEDWDRLGTPSKARAWLLEKRLVSRPVRITRGDAARLRGLREALRALLAADNGTGVDPDSLATLRREAGGVTLRIGFDDGGATALEPGIRGADGAVAALLGIQHEAQLTGAWPRLKGAGSAAAFFDRSKNRSAAGARCRSAQPTKNRAYRRRRAATR
jgi:hypothetical protein